MHLMMKIGVAVHFTSQGSIFSTLLSNIQMCARHIYACVVKIITIFIFIFYISFCFFILLYLLLQPSSYCYLDPAVIYLLGLYCLSQQYPPSLFFCQLIDLVENINLYPCDSLLLVSIYILLQLLGITECFWGLS